AVAPHLRLCNPSHTGLSTCLLLSHCLSSLKYLKTLLLYVVCIHRIGNVMYFTYVKKLFSLADLSSVICQNHSEKAHRGGKPNLCLNEGGVREPGKWTSNAVK